MKTNLGRKLIVATLAVMTFAVLGNYVRAQDSSEKTFTGVVSDAMCASKHSMTNMSSADCTRMCVKAGQAYALVVGDTVYTLQGHAAELDKYAGQKVTLKGRLKDKTVTVDSVAAAI